MMSDEPLWQPVDPRVYDEDQQRLHALLVSTRGREQVEDAAGRLRAAYALMVLHPPLGSALERLGTGLRRAEAVPADLRELAILRVAAATGSRVQWRIHLPLARAAGIDSEELADAPDAVPVFEDDRRVLVWRLTAAWCADTPGSVDDRRRLIAILGERGLYELVSIVGYYRLLAGQMAVFDIDEA